MPLYHRVLTDKGYEMVEQDLPTFEQAPIILPELASPTLIPPASTRYVCSVCKPAKKFNRPGVASMHFNKAHRDLMRDKDTWREYVRVEHGPNG